MSDRPEYTLLGTDDAMVWSSEFCRIWEGKTVTLEESDEIDPGLMVSWFANAMQVAIDMDQRRRMVTARTNEDLTITIETDPIPDQILISKELLLEMINQHNQSL